MATDDRSYRSTLPDSRVIVEAIKSGTATYRDDLAHVVENAAFEDAYTALMAAIIALDGNAHPDRAIAARVVTTAHAVSDLADAVAPRGAPAAPVSPRIPEPAV